MSDDAKADMRGLSPNTRRDVNEVLRRLRSGIDRDLDLRLKDEDDLWRAYAGRRWRVIFEVQPGRRILVRRIRRRPDAYRGIEHPHRRELREPEASYEAVGRSEPLPSTQESAMSDSPPPNGTDANEHRERPSWYIEFEPIPEDDQRTGAEVIESIFGDVLGDEPPDLSPEVAAATKAFLDQFLVPRDS